MGFYNQSSFNGMSRGLGEQSTEILSNKELKLPYRGYTMMRVVPEVF